MNRRKKEENVDTSTEASVNTETAANTFTHQLFAKNILEMESACEKAAERDTLNIADTGQTVQKDVDTSPANICMSGLKNTVR